MLISSLYIILSCIKYQVINCGTFPTLTSQRWVNITQIFSKVFGTFFLSYFSHLRLHTQPLLAEVFNIWKITYKHILICISLEQFDLNKTFNIYYFLSEREETMGGLLHYSPNFYNYVFLFLKSTTLGTVIKFWLVRSLNWVSKRCNH